jgi:molecular chaperone GrpE (heat shock protein)
MDKKKVWREQEQRLVERWNAASDRCRGAEAEIAKQDGPPPEAILNEVATAKAELESMRKQLARIKAEFREGKRY